MPRLVAFLRAINTPPRYVKMQRLKSVFESLGLERVETFIASGNVVFDAGPEKRLGATIETALEAELGFEVPTFLRTADAVVAVADARPFGRADDGMEISFLVAEPDPGAAKALVESAAGNDRLAVIGREVYWLHQGPRGESSHSEASVVKTLGMLTTRRSAQTVRRLADKYLR